MRLTFRHRDPEGARFARSPWDDQVGKTIPFNFGEGLATTAEVVAAKVLDGGWAVELTLEVPDGVVPLPPSTRQIQVISWGKKLESGL